MCHWLWTIFFSIDGLVVWIVVPVVIPRFRRSMGRKWPI